MRYRAGGKVFISAYRYVWEPVEKIFGADVEECWTSLLKYRLHDTYVGDTPPAV